MKRLRLVLAVAFACTGLCVVAQSAAAQSTSGGGVWLTVTNTWKEGVQTACGETTTTNPPITTTTSECGLGPLGDMHCLEHSYDYGTSGYSRFDESCTLEVHGVGEVTCKDEGVHEPFVTTLDGGCELTTPAGGARRSHTESGADYGETFTDVDSCELGALRVTCTHSTLYEFGDPPTKHVCEVPLPGGRTCSIGYFTQYKLVEELPTRIDHATTGCRRTP